MSDQERISKRGRVNEGRPLKFETAEQLQEKIDEYFQWADQREKPYTIGGLALFLNTDHKTIRNYEAKDQFFQTMQKARLRIITDKEERLNEGKATAGIIFDLCNNNSDLYSNKHDEKQRPITIIANNPIKE